MITKEEPGEHNPPIDTPQFAFLLRNFLPYEFVFLTVQHLIVAFLDSLMLTMKVMVPAQSGLNIHLQYPVVECLRNIMVLNC